MSAHDLMIIKASGEKVPFSASKLIRSLEKANAPSEIIDQILTQVEENIVDGTTTRELYQYAYDLLKEYSRPAAGRYQIKQALFDLGPSGYRFEQFVSKLLQHEGYTTQVGLIVQGHCVQHEIDVEAQRDHHHFMIECKFHNRHGTKSNVKVPLYIKSRFDDVKKQWELQPGHSQKFHQGWIVTNTKFTEDAIQYGECMHLKLIGWNYPKKGSLNDRITTSGLFPLTCLTTLTKAEKQKLLDRDLLLCKEVVNNKPLLKSLGMSDTRIEETIRESREICRLLTKSKEK